MASHHPQGAVMPLEIRKSGAPLGHEIRGVDLTCPLADSTFAEIEQAFNDYGVVVIRDQKLTPAQHLAFTRRFGETERYPVGNFTLPGHDEILVVSNIIENGQPIGLIDAGRNWHSDMLFTEKPPRCSLLYSLEVPHQDGKAIGDTLFASTSAAYEGLPDDLKNRLTGLKARHSFSTYAGTKTDGREKEGAAFADVIHPLVRTHPVTGKKCLYLSHSLTQTIGKMNESETGDLVRQLIAHITSAPYVYRHQWRVGDLVIWDNCSSMHRAMFDYALPQRRRMHRTTVAGGRPF
jgi:taurine dioxygenase